MGRRMAGSDWLPRFRRFLRNPSCRRCYSTYWRCYGRTENRQIHKGQKAGGYSGTFTHLRCSRLFYPLVWLVRLQRCRCHNRTSARFYFPDDNHCSRCRNSSVHDLHMAEIWQARCFHVPECITCRSCRYNSRL